MANKVLKNARATVAVLGLVTALGGCDEAEGPELADELEISCEGKCDGLGKLRNLMRDVRDLSLDDLLNLAAPKVFEELSDAVSTNSVKVELSTPLFHDAQSVAALSTGLAARYGERELSTEVNRVRADHLASSTDTTYAEVALRIGGSLSSSWSSAVEGLTDTTASLGFSSGASVEGRFIAAMDLPAGDPVNHLRALRGFSIPRNVADMRKMSPGELVALRGEGNLGINLGVGVPLLVAEPLSALTYSIVLTAGLRSQLSGVLDIQLVRLAGDELIVDVGIERAKVKSARIAIEDRWGVQGLLEANVEIAGINVDLGKLVDKALQSQLNDKVKLIAAHAERSKNDTRTSVARFRVDLAKADPERLQAALGQAAAGDVRLAQALANAGEPGIEAEFDFLRSGIAATSSAGIDIFGLSFFKETIAAEGSVIVQTPGGARSLMFDSLEEKRGRFVLQHGYRRVGIAGLVFDGAGRAVDSEANLFVQLSEGDKAMQRDKIVDHLDAMIVALAGAPAYEAIDLPANALERYTQGLCPGAKIHDPCTWESAQDPELVPMRAAALATFATAIAHVPEASQPLLMTLAEHKLLAQSTYEVKHNGYIGPGTDIVVDFRLDDATLAGLALYNDGSDLTKALLEVLVATEVDRDQSKDAVKSDRKAIAADKAVLARLGAMEAHYDAFATSYTSLLQAESATVATVGELGARALEIRFGVDSKNAPIYEDATVRSLVKARSDLVTSLFDALHEDADGLGPHAEQVVAYGLLALSDEAHRDLSVEVEHFLDDTWATTRKPYRATGYPERIETRARGEQNQRIDGGLFDIDALLVVE